MVDSLLEHQADAVPSAREHVRQRHAFQRHQREFGIGFAGQRQLEHAQLLPAQDRGQDGLVRFYLCLELGECPFREWSETGPGETRHRACLSVPFQMGSRVTGWSF